MNDRVEIRVYVRLPWAEEEKIYSYAIDQDQAFRSLRPISRQFPLDQMMFFEASKQYDRRRELIEMVSKMIAAALMDACESKE